MTTTACPRCGNAVSPDAFDCPHCGHPLKKPRRSVFGRLIKLLFILFNLAMIAWLISYWVAVGDLATGATSDAEMAGLGLGATAGTGMLITLWAMGDIILGLAVLLTRPRRR